MKKVYDIIAFDLDGTLTDPSRGFIEGCKYAFSKMGMECESDEALKRFIGPALFDEWQICYGFSPEEARRAVMLFREYYSVYGWWDNEIYPGVREMLAALKSGGKKLILATSKPEVFARNILDKFSLTEYFDFIGAATSNLKREKKWEVLSYALDGIGARELSKCIMVGDRKYDAEGAKICGIDSLGVLYGHGTWEEHIAAGFNYVCKTTRDVTDILI